MDAPDFAFETYIQNYHDVFKPPAPIHRLSIGQDRITCQYMLNTVHIEEASYEGNDRVLKKWWRQLKVDAPKKKMMGEDNLIVWAGDQLTVSRIRGLHRFRAEDLNSYDRLAFLKEIPGWFHTQIALEHSLHSQYYGTQSGFGLVHAFDLLKRKGLHAPSVQGTFHHHLQEVLLHIAEARFQDIWLVVGKVKKLEELRDRAAHELHELAALIVDDYASTAALRKMKAKKARKDELLYQLAQMAHDLLDYIHLNDAIKAGDVGAIQDMIPRLLFRFVGGKNKNYAIDIRNLTI